MADDTEKRLHSVMEKLFHTPKHSSLASDQTRGVKRPHSALMSKHTINNNSNKDEGVLAKALPCRPWDRGDLMRRLATFKSMTWFAKPKAVDAVNCARRGWINVEMDVIACEICGARLLFTTPASWNRHQVEKAASVFSLKLDNGHKLLCPWMDNCCDDKLAYFAPTRTEVLVEQYKERSSSLLKLSALPLISASAITSMKSPLLDQFVKQVMSVENDTGPDASPWIEAVSTNSYYQAHRLLSLCGWQPRILPYVVDCNESAKKSRTSQENGVEVNNRVAVYICDSDEKEGNSVVFDCKLCGASTGLWAFTLVSRPLELVRVVGYTENHAAGDTSNMVQKGSMTKLNMTIAGGPLPAEQNFRATISVPVIGRNLRARFSNSDREVTTDILQDVGQGDEVVTEFSAQEGSNGTDQNVQQEEMVPASDDSQNKTDDIQPSIDKDPKRASSGNKMEFDPVRQHRHFCPMVTSTETVCPGWKQILLALKKEKFFTATESEDSPMSPSLIKIDDPITSIRRLFKSPSSKPARSTRGSS